MLFILAISWVLIKRFSLSARPLAKPTEREFLIRSTGNYPLGVLMRWERETLSVWKSNADVSQNCVCKFFSFITSLPHAVATRLLTQCIVKIVGVSVNNARHCPWLSVASNAAIPSNLPTNFQFSLILVAWLTRSPTIDGRIHSKPINDEPLFNRIIFVLKSIAWVPQA